jgi:hypothetical protein
MSPVMAEQKLPQANPPVSPCAHGGQAGWGEDLPVL